MTKEQLRIETKWLLYGDYGNHGEEGIGNEGILLPEKIRCKHHLGCGWNEGYIYEVFCSDTESGVAVGTYNCVVIDFMELDLATANKVYHAVKKQREEEKIRIKSYAS